jgi:V/A-type H+-transporting ATPase subunit F
VNYVFLGEPELASAFRLAGVEGRAVRDSESAHGIFAELTRPITSGGFERNSPQDASCQVLILTEQVALWLDSELTEWQLSGRYPLVVEVPGLGGPLPGKKSLVDSIREAIGIHV